MLSAFHYPTTLPHFHFGGFLDHIQAPHHFPRQIDLLNVCFHMAPGEAAILLVLGVLLVLFGFNIYKFVVMINVALVGAALGSVVGEKAGNPTVGATIGGFVAAVISWPLMKHAVTIMGVTIGAAAGAGLWRAFSLNPEFLWAGGLVGAITMGMMSFLLFDGCVMIATSLQGSTMAVVGVLAIVMKYHNAAGKIADGMDAHRWILPASIFVPALCGWIFQHMPGPAGGKPPAKK
jgi:hypothetical protein